MGQEEESDDEDDDDNDDFGQDDYDDDVNDESDDGNDDIGEDNVDDDDCQVPLAMPQRVKREAHDVILDFIRSRPPLKPVRYFFIIFWFLFLLKSKAPLKPVGNIFNSDFEEQISFFFLTSVP